MLPDMPIAGEACLIRRITMPHQAELGLSVPS